MPFFQFTQNNSGGRFTGPAKYVLVEANSAKQANERALDRGLYFDGSGDCSCCGPRWSPVWEDETGDTVPSVYGEPLTDTGARNVEVFRLDGTVGKT